VPGFGQGPFGAEPFGEWEWSKQVLWYLIPRFYREQDPDYGGYFERLMEALRPPFDLFRLRIQNLETLRDPLRCRTRYDEAVIVRLGRQVVLPGRIEQQGLDGSVVTEGVFYSPTATFGDEDIGKQLDVTRSLIQANNQTYVVAAVVDLNSVITDPLISVDTGPLRWTLRPETEEAAGRVTVQVVSGDTSDIQPGWLLNDGDAEHFVVAKRRFSSTESQTVVDRYGAAGAINSSGQFVVGTGPFSRRDVGKRFSIRGQADEDDDGKYEISRVVSETTLELIYLDGTATSLPENLGPLEWVLLPFPELELAATLAPKGVAEKQGVDLSVTGSTVTDPNALFTTTDIGKFIQIRNSAFGNDGVYEILALVDNSTATVDGTLVAESDLVWYTRPKTTVGDLAQVEVHAESLLKFLAQDFGIVIDNQETEERQRSWVRNVTRWLQRKGTEASYRALGKVSGFDVEVSQLFRISHEWFGAIPAADQVEVGDADPGRFGSDGSLTPTVGGGARFGSPTAAFRATDVGSQVRITGAVSALNNGRFTIATFVDANTVEFLVTDPHVAPDANNGSLSWGVVRVYSDLPPTLPLYDETNIDLVQAITNSESDGATDFRVDKFCWEEDWSSDVPVDVQGSVQSSYNLFDVTVVHDTGAFASSFVGSGADGTVDLVADAIGADANDYQVVVVSPVPAVNQPLSVTWVSEVLTITLGTDGAGVLDPTKNTATLVAAAVNVAAGVDMTAIATGTGASSLTTVEAIKNFTGGKDEFLDAPEVVILTGRWTLVDGNDVQYWLETVPAETASGPPPEYTFRVTSLVAPATGPAVLRYVCDPQLSCSFCPSYRAQATAELGDVAGEGARAVERLWERLVLRLEQTTPAHVDLILVRKQVFEAQLDLTAEVEYGLVFSAELYAPLTVYDGEVDADLYPADTILDAEIEAPAPKTRFRGMGTMTLLGRTT